MENHKYEFVQDHKFEHIIKVIGVGGGGSNAVNHMYNKGIFGVDFVVTNTDMQALEDSPVQNKLQLGAILTEGLGAGTDAKNGELAALETESQIRDMLSEPNKDGKKTKMVFITAGMGGGTGTGAAPVIARIAKELEILTVAIVTFPFEHEGNDKLSQAKEGVRKLQEHCDTVLVVLNDKLIEMYADLDIDTAFAHADNILTDAAKSIAEVITNTGKVNVDFKDVEMVLKNAGQAVMGSSIAAGSDRALRVITEALDSPLLNNREITGAKRILLTVSYSDQKKMLLSEQAIITKYVLEKIGTSPNALKLGYFKDNSLSDEMRITVIAAGFGGSDTLDNKPKILKVDSYESQNELLIETPQGAAHETVAETVTVQYHGTIDHIVKQFEANYPTEAELLVPAYKRHEVALIVKSRDLVVDSKLHQL
jgi:cell division protein FtsZ